MLRRHQVSWSGAVVFLAVLLVPVSSLAQTTAADEIPARLRHFEGTVTVQRAAVSDTQDAVVNLPLGRGDRVVTAADGRAEITLDDGSTVWLDARSSLDFLSLSSADPSGGMIVRLWAGSLYVDRPLPPTGRLAPLRIDAPNGTVMLDRDGLFRVDLDQNQGVWLSVYDGTASLTAGGLTEVVGAGQRSLAEAGTAPALAAAFNTVETDGFDGWRAERVAFYAESHQYVRARDYIPRTIVHHAADLEPYGAWAYDTGLSSWYWKPYATIAWTPYRYGRWVYTYGGWSWVPSAPWGYVTTHYGRWHHTGYNGWAWFPGSVWSHASVHWYIGPRYVGWVPLNYYGRPAVSFSVHFGGRGRFPTYDYGRRGVSVGRTGSAFGGRTVNGLGYRAGPDAWTVVPQESFGSPNTARRAIARNALPADLDRSSRTLRSGTLRARELRRLTPTGRAAVSRNGYRATGTTRPSTTVPRRTATPTRTARPSSSYSRSPTYGRRSTRSATPRTVRPAQRSRSVRPSALPVPATRLRTRAPRQSLRTAPTARPRISGPRPSGSRPSVSRPSSPRPSVRRPQGSAPSRGSRRAPVRTARPRPGGKPPGGSDGESGTS